MFIDGTIVSIDLKFLKKVTPIHGMAFAGINN